MRLAVFVATGLGYGVVLRLWMRFVSTEPEFTWSGTGYVVGAFTVLGLMAGLVDLGHRRGWRRSLIATRTAGSVLALGCFTAAGAAMFPTIVPAALAVARTDWPRVLRGLLLAVAVAAAAAVVLAMPLTPGHRLAALALYLPLCAVETGLLARILAPSLPAGTIARRPRAVRLALVGLPLLVLAALTVAARGVSA